MKHHLVLLLIFPLGINAQNYYRDILGTAETNQMMRLYKKMNVISVTSAGFNENNQPVPGFFEKQEVDSANNLLKITRSYDNRRSAEWLYFDTLDHIIRHIDSSDGFRSETEYIYDDRGRLNVIHNITTDTTLNINESEYHFWEYGPNDVAIKMTRVINAADTTEFRLSADENGNIIEETAYKKNRPGEKVYYYYNDNNQITDVVRYNKKARKLLPDFMFEYSETGKVIQKITTHPNPKLGYIIWRYQFDDSGLKQREANFNKEKKLIGRIDYRYAFAK